MSIVEISLESTFRVQIQGIINQIEQLRNRVSMFQYFSLTLGADFHETKIRRDTITQWAPDNLGCT